jgi:hypothetical protein
MYKYFFSFASRMYRRTFSLLNLPSDNTITKGQFIDPSLTFYISSNLFASDTKLAIEVSADVFAKCLNSNYETM